LRFSKRASHLVGHPRAFVLAVLLVLAWVAGGLTFGFTDRWQLLINSTTAIITFLIVFLIQHTQNRDTAAIHLKLDELVRSTQGAHNEVLDLEELPEDELERMRDEYEKLAAEARAKLRGGGDDTGTPAVRRA
jgi:low affinity Fe/Cu permease